MNKSKIAIVSGALIGLCGTAVGQTATNPNDSISGGSRWITTREYPPDGISARRYLQVDKTSIRKQGPYTAYRLRVVGLEKASDATNGDVDVVEHLLDCVNRKIAVHPLQPKYNFDLKYPSPQWSWRKEEPENATTF